MELESQLRHKFRPLTNFPLDIGIPEQTPGILVLGKQLVLVEPFGPPMSGHTTKIQHSFATLFSTGSSQLIKLTVFLFCFLDTSVKSCAGGISHFKSVTQLAV